MGSHANARTHVLTIMASAAGRVCSTGVSTFISHIDNYSIAVLVICYISGEYAMYIR